LAQTIAAARARIDRQKDNVGTADKVLERNVAVLGSTPRLSIELSRLSPSTK
jgi:hypothetical protein